MMLEYSVTSNITWSPSATRARRATSLHNSDASHHVRRCHRGIAVHQRRRRDHPRRWRRQGTALNGNGGTISLTAGTSGITALAANNSAAEIATTGATVTLNTTGPIGTSSNCIQFADNASTAQQNVVVGSASQPSSVYLDGLGSLTLGNVQTANGAIDVTARTNLVVASNATINSGAGALSLGADLTAARSGDDGVGTLTVNANAGVYGANITLRGADEDIATTATVGAATAGAQISTFLSVNGHNPILQAFDSAGNLYIANYNANTITKVTLAGIASTFVSSGLNGPFGLAFDSAGNLYVSNAGANTVSKVTPAGAVSVFASGTLFNGPAGLALDTAGNLYVANSNLTGLSANSISKVTPAGAVSTFVSSGSGLSAPDGIAFDAAGNLYVANEFNSTVSKWATAPEQRRATEDRGAQKQQIWQRATPV